MNKLIDIYRLVDNIETLIYSVSNEDATSYENIMDKDKVTVNIVTEDPIYLKEGDYIYQNSIKYKINRDPEDRQKSDKEHSYSINFEAPIYTLIDKYYCNKITGNTTVTLTGKLRDFLDLLIWNINKDSNPLGVDNGWTIGLCPDTDYMNITLNGVKCRDVLDTLSSKFGLEYYVKNKTVNYVSHIENETGLIFTQGKGRGLYEVERKNVDDGDLVTRVYAKGGTNNVIPGEGEDGRLVLPEGYIENFSESTRGVEAIVEFDNIHPTFQGTVGALSGDNNREFICSAIDFDIASLAVGDEARVNFLTGDLMGKSFEFKWDNPLKKITLIYQEDTLASVDVNTGTRPNVPSASKYLRGGELFNLTGLKMSGTYKTNAITKLRQKATEWLAYYCRKRVKFELNVDYRYLRENNITLHCGDLITINVPLHNISKLIRITSIEKNLYTGKLTCIVSNYLDEKWKDKIETEVANIKSSTTTANGGYGGSSSVSIIEKNDEREASDSNVFSSLRVLKEIKDRALSKTEADTAQKLITFLEGLTSGQLAKLNKGATFGEFIAGLSGASIDENGNGEVNSLKVRDYLETQEMRKNRITVNGNEFWFTDACYIESVERIGTTDQYIITPRLPDGDLLSFRSSDILRGIYNYDTGFYTSILQVVTVNETLTSMTVVSLNGKAPMPYMVLARQTNSADPTRQGSIYADGLNKFIRILDGYNPDDPGAMGVDQIMVQLGDLSNLYHPDFGQLYGSGLMAQNANILGNLRQISHDRKTSQRIVFWRGVFNENESYGESDLVRWMKPMYGESTYRCIAPTVKDGNGKTPDPSNSAYWELYIPAGEPAYVASIESSKGNSFLNGNVDTTLFLVVKMGASDITSQISDANITWTRETSDTASDEAWNMSHVGAGKYVNILRSDLVQNRAKFNVEVKIL